MTIHFWHGLQQGPVLNSFKQIVHEWNKEHVDAQVELKDFADYGAPAKEAFAKQEHEQPSLVLAPEFQTSTLMEALKQKRIIPINALIGPEQLQEIAEIVKRTFGNKEGQLASLPLNPACGVLYTNQNLLQEIGKDPHYVPSSLEELEEVCQALSKKGLSAGYTCAWPAAYLVEVPAAQQNLALVSPENGKLGYGNYKLSQEWLKRHFLDLRQQQKNGVFVYAGQSNDARKPFIEGKIAFFMQGSTHYSLLQQEAQASAKPFKVGCGALPTLVRGQKENYAFPLGGASIWILNNTQTTKMIQGVRQFLNYLAEKEFQERWHKETGYVPVRKSLPKALEEFYKGHPLHQAVVRQTIEATLGAFSFGIHTPNYADARRAIFQLIETILDVNTSDEKVEQLLKSFDEKWSIPEPSQR